MYAHPQTIAYEAFISDLPGFLPVGSLNSINIFPYNSRGIEKFNIDAYLDFARRRRGHQIPDYAYAYILGYKRWTNSRWNNVVRALYPTDPALIAELDRLLRDDGLYQIVTNIFYQTLNSIRYQEEIKP